MTDIEKVARELYERSRTRVSGRPKWEDLNPDDPYDMGMKENAMTIAEYGAPGRAKRDRT